MVFALLLALAGLTLSAVAIYYSVIGLTAVFAAAFWPVVVMGTTLELSKLVAASWLKAYWSKIPTGMRIYMSTAVVVLMIITSMGIFGFLSKAHLDQNIVSGDVQSKIAIYDEKIQTERENIDAARKALAQMDAQVNERLSRSTDDRGAERAVQIRRQQQAERTRLQNDISRSQSNIAKLNEERSPIAAEVRKVEAEVGPIKYIAKLIYGDNPDANILEKAVTWVIMIIVFVFDPLAVLMLLGAQMTYKWARDQENESMEGDSPEKESDIVSTATVTGQEDIDLDYVNQQLAEAAVVEEPYIEEPKREEKVLVNPHPVGWMYPKHANIQDYRVEDADEEEFDATAHAKTYNPEEKDIVETVGVDAWNEMIAEAEKAVDAEKEAMRKWKEDHPGETIKETRLKKDLGIIEELPWAADVERPGDYLPESESKKKTTYIVKENNQQVRKTKDL